MKMILAAIRVSLCLLTAILVAYAQGASLPAAPAQTLAQALAQAKVTADTVYLTVAAEKAMLPKDTDPTPLPPGAPVPQVADAYGRVTQAWKSVTAIAPPEMTTVYAPPDTPNPYDGMPTGQVLKLLAGTFTPDQWKTFFEPSGLGYADLQTDAQRSLFAALFPGGHLAVEKDNPTGPNDPKTRQDITGDALLQARLRLGYSVNLGLQAASRADEHIFDASFRPSDAPTRYVMLNGQSYNADHEFGGTVRETGPSTLKPGDLDAATLTAPVPLGSIRTVDDLVTHLGLALHLELYADARYGARTVTLIGTAKTARAGDLLRALALCVSGTYRKVGPAYVLTDDLMGLGTKHILWKEFEEKAQAMLPPDADPNSPVKSPYSIEDIPWSSADPMAFTVGQQKQFWKQWRANPEHPQGNIPTLTIPFSQLSPGQQEVAQYTNSIQHGETTLNGTVTVQGNLELEATLPSLDGPVALDGDFRSLLPPPSLTPAEQTAQQKQMAAEEPPSFRQDAPTPLGPLRLVVQGFARRAVRLAPHDAAELTHALTSMKVLGFNELWLEITPGTHRKDSNVNREDDNAALALLAQAVKLGGADDITVFPDIHLLRWADGTPKGLWDRDLMGRTAAEANKAARYPIPEVPDTVTPFAPEVWDRLSLLVRAAGATPGIGGMVWEDLPPAGYQAFIPNGPDMSGYGDAPLGFAEAGRLALLRAAHAGPVDLYTNSYSDERAHVSVPDFGTGNDQGYDLSTQNQMLYNRWRTLRARMALDLARHLASLLPPAFLTPGAARRPLLLPPANESSRYPGSQYGSWDDLRKPLPTDVFVPLPGPAGQGGTTGTMKMATTLNYSFTRFFAMAGKTASDRRENIARTLYNARSGGSRNIVLDLTQAPGLLEVLAAAEPAKTTAVGR